MALLTVSELQTEAALPSRNVDLTGFSNAILTSKIEWATGYIQNGSNRDFSTESDEDILLEAKDICMDLTFIKLQAPNRRDVKQLKEGDVTFTYTDINSFTMAGIDKRIAAIYQEEDKSPVLAYATR